MKVLNLQCGFGHRFEGWFGNEAEFQSQVSRGLLNCPVCGEGGIIKMPSAPRLNLRGAESLNAPVGSSSAGVVSGTSDRFLSDHRPDSSGETTSPGAPSSDAKAVLVNALRELMARTEDVGDRFAQEARRMHYGEEAVRPIRGQTTFDDALALQDEGIRILPLPNLLTSKDDLH